MPVLTRSQKKRQSAKIKTKIDTDSDSENESPYKPPPRARRVRISKPSKSKSKSKSKVKCKTKMKPQATNTRKKSAKKKKSHTNKRKLSEKSQNVGTPPNKKKKTKEKKVTPSKELANLMGKVHISKDDKDRKKLQFEAKEEEEEEEDRDTEIRELQEKLLTQEVDYDLIGRDSEYKQIKMFIETRLKSGRGDSFYICGSPGTGKTATLQSITNYFLSTTNKKRFGLQDIIKINGMSLHNPSSIYNVLYKKIFNTEKNLKPIDAKNKLEKYFIPQNDKLLKNQKMYIVIIDEMDGLLGNTQQQVLYHLFGWTKQINCKLILFGIANSIDLTDRFLPRLKQRNFEPELLIFKSYTKEQLVNIMKFRMNGYEQYIDNIAINLCATKVAKMYGDIRKCLEICRNALTLLLQNEEIEKISFMEMKQTLSGSFESPLIEVIKHLPNHQKTIVVLSTVLINKTISKKYIIYNKLEQFYQFMAKKYILPKTSSREFNVIIDQLITDNIMQTITKQKQRILSNDTRLQVMVPYDDIQFSVQQDEILNKFFQIDLQIPKKYLN